MIVLADDAIHVWRFPAGPFDSPCEEDRAAFLVRSRALVLRTLGRYRKITPVERASGRCARSLLPSSTSAAGPAIVHSVSRSAGATVVAVSRKGPLGIDIERIDPSFRWDSIARRLFAASEKADLERCPPAMRPAAFFKGWVSKEAYLKGLGLGLSGSMRRFVVCCDPDMPPRLTAGLPGDGVEWRLAPVDLGAGFAGVVAHAGGAAAVTIMNRE